MQSLTRKKRRKSFRTAINKKCRSCIYDPAGAGTWRQQVTLCSCLDCPLYELRPISCRPIPDRVLRYYSVDPDNPILLRIDGRTANDGQGPSRQVLPGPVGANRCALKGQPASKDRF